jgi:hypothetical protein
VCVYVSVVVGFIRFKGKMVGFIQLGVTFCFFYTCVYIYIYMYIFVLYYPVIEHAISICIQYMVGSPPPCVDAEVVYTSLEVRNIRRDLKVRILIF